MKFLLLYDLLGVFVFAISGVLTAADKKFDVFGASVIAFVTAAGGGTIRDVILGSYPVVWIRDPRYLYIIIAGITFSLLFRRHINKFRRTLFLFDAIGIGVYTILGVQKALALGVAPAIAVIMGTISAVFGGVTRDVLCGEAPLIFRKEIYAVPCMIGGIVYISALYFFNSPVAITAPLAALFVIAIRLLAVKFKWTMPSLGGGVKN